MQPLKRNLLSMALASATLMLANGAYAQSADQDQAADDAQDLDTIQVVGIRRSIEEAIDTKQNTTAIVEAISAEDIGKLPDTSIADSIARLPGLTAQRFGNRPQEINIRGFAGDFSSALLNGREQVSLGNNRGVEFDQYPSEFASQVIVNKATQADLVGQGLSGTVNIKTIRPLAYGKQAFAANLRADQNRIGSEKENGYRASVSYIDQFADNTVGIALGYAHLNNPGQGHQYESWGFNGTGLLDGGKFYDISQENERDGFAGTLEFKPNDMYSTVLDVFYSKFDKEETKRGLEFGIGADWSGANLVSRTNNAAGTATSASFTNVPRPVIRNDFNAAYDDLFSIGWTHTLRLNDHWTITADISGSEAVRDERILETYAGMPASAARDSLSYSLNDGYFDVDFGYDYGNAAALVLTDAGGWGQDGYIKDFRVKDALSALRFDAERSFDSGFISSLKFGVNLTDRTKSRSSNENFLDLAGGANEAPIPTQYISGGSSFNFGNTPSILNLDALAMFNGGVYQRRGNVNADISNKNWEVKEQVTTLYAQAAIDTEFGSIPVKGNVGFQVVNAEQESSGRQTFPGNGFGADTSGGASQTDFLPSLNLSFQLPWEQYVRVAASRQMARPRMDDLRANENIDYERNNPSRNRSYRVWTRNGGNPELEPTVANAYDVAYEKYFDGTKGYVGVAYFYKDLRTYIYNDYTSFDIREITAFPPSQYPAGSPTTNEGDFTRPVNGTGGVVKGWELTASLPLGTFWAPLEGFGIQANYSDTRSSIKPQGPTGPDEPIPGLSKYITNATVYYERFGFSARVAQRKRSQFVGEVQGFGGDRTKIAFNAETVTDVQLGYTIQNGPLKNLAFLLQVNNLENEPFTSSFDGRSDRPRQFFEYGRTYLFGVNWRY